MPSEGLASRPRSPQPILGNPASVVPPHFAGLDSSLANQLRNVALLIEGRAQTGLQAPGVLRRPAGYDTHGEQLEHPSAIADRPLARDRAPSRRDDSARHEQQRDDVSRFPTSDATLKPASNQGTDHGWGNYAFVVGGAVKGGDFYGTVPTLALNGPDDFGKEGRWIPTTSIEQYGATLCRWFGIAEADLPYVFPNIGAFANTNLGFMT